MSDLPDRILAAIEETRRHAEELKAVQPTLMRFYVSMPDGRSIVVTSDPDDDLRRCEADKHTVQRHAVVGRIEWRDGQPHDYCGTCWRLMPCADLVDRAAAWDVEAP